MAVDIWEAGKEVYGLMKSLIGDIEDHHPLVDVQDNIAIVMKDSKPPKDPTVVVTTGKTSRAPAVLSALGKTYHFIVTLNAREWKNFSEAQKKAQIDHCLCAMKVKYNEKTDEYSYSIRKPDVAGYSGEFQRNGVWMELPGSDTGTSPVEELFNEE